MVQIIHLHGIYNVNVKGVMFEIITNIVVSWDEMIWLQYEKDNS